jgi:hypothetical protein
MGGIDGIAGFINNLNQFTQTIGAVQGAAEALAPAVYAVDHSINQIASVFTGDQYTPYNPYPAYPVYPPMPVGFMEEGKVGIIGNMLAGGAAGAMTHQQTTEAIKTIKAGQTGAGFKALGMSSLKAGGIGAAVTGVISAAKNVSLVSKGMQTGADAGGNITADTVGGLLAGATGGLAAGAAGMALSSMGAAGVGLTIGAAVAGAVGATGASLLYKMTGMRDGLANSVRSMFGGGANNYYPPHNGYPPNGHYPQPVYGY